ncbi:MAG: two-component system, OmpR family, sensor histidine kinase VicK [Candidatus Petromonas sp.]|nr:two-component system, OmpR family, sensor histidine kinase VicK [Candidatus Petromonas sp.]
MFKSIRWKFITIYFTLVFIAMAIVGVFIIQKFEAYHLNVSSERLNMVAKDYILPGIQKIPPGVSLEDGREEFQKVIDRWSTGFFREEIFIIKKDFEIIATNNPGFNGENAIDELEDVLIVEGFKGQIVEKDKISRDPTQDATKNLVFPIIRNEKVEGVLYLRDNLTDIYETLNKSKRILTQATFLALAITVLLGYLIAKSVTEPINDVTKKAAHMAKGDFDQRVEIKSDDEIGKLAEMFNYLTEKLKTTLGEISSEKSKMETILNYMADGLIAVNMDGKIIHANPKAMEMLKVNQEVFTEGDYDGIFEKLNEKLSLKYIKTYNESWIGSEVININESIYKASYAPYKNERNERGGLVLVIQDVTEQQRLENMRREFVANVSHELKTPITSIKSYTETLLSGALEDKNISERFLKVIHDESNRMARLVRDLLQLSNFDYRQTELSKERKDLAKLIKQSVMKLEMAAKNKNQRLEFVTEEEEMFGYFDHDRIEQVLLNIISNAIKYTEEDGEVKVHLEKEDGNAVLSVKDTGIGIPKEDLPRIFERFYRVDKARSRELGGTGLGLSIAKEIIEAHSGTIEIFSEVGEGTDVIIKLPLEENVV